MKEGQWVENDDISIMFQGPHAYISSSWYEAREIYQR
ncbi:FMN-binding negative transcriptional regulator [Cytobacillus sp. NCCP-133]